MYSTDRIAKDSKIDAFYVIKNGKCRQYTMSSDYYNGWNLTVGELSNMTDEEVIKALEMTYLSALESAGLHWSEYDFIVSAVNTGKSKLYIPREYDLVSYLETDDSGNRVIHEIVGFPCGGVGGYLNALYYPDPSSSNAVLNYFSGGEDDAIIEGVHTDLNRCFFLTGYGLKEDFNRIANWYCFSDDFTTSGTVYNSHYLGFQSKSSTWTKTSDMLIFRDENAYNLTISLDSLNSPYMDKISYIDPSKNDIDSLLSAVFNRYYRNFGSIDEFVEYNTFEHGYQYIAGVFVKTYLLFEMDEKYEAFLVRMKEKGIEIPQL